jgi:hypothetical protein
MKAIQSISKILNRFISIVLIFIFIGNNDALSQSCIPSALFSAANISTPRCHNQNIIFTNPNALPGVYRFRFYSSTNVLLAGPVTVISNGTNTQIFPSGTNYKAVLIHEDAACKDSIVIPFNVDAYPVAPAFTNNGPKCANTATGFNVTSPITGLTYSWTFGDAGSGASNNATGTTANHVYPIASNGLGANYNVVLTATSLLGCATSGAEASLAVKATPKIDLGDPNFQTGFNWRRCQLDANSIDSTYSFYFDNHSLGSAGTSYTFNWGDGTPGTTVLQNSLPDTLVHLYTSFGVKNGTLLATDPNGCSAAFPFKVVNEKFPSASLSIPSAQISICDGTTLTVSNNSRNATSYTWIWGDGDSTSTNSINAQNHLYALKDSVACQVSTALGLETQIKLIASNSCYNHFNTSPLFIRPLPRLNLEFDTLVCVDSITNLVSVPFDLFVCPNRMMTNNATLTTIVFNDPFASPVSNPDSIIFDPNVPLTNISHQFKPGAYQIAAKAKNNCGTSIKTKLLTISSTTDVKKDFSSSTPVIYPNPLTGFELHIDRADASDIRVYDVMGKLYLPQFRIENEECILLLGNLPAGMYFLDFESREKQMRMKISK